MKKNLVILLTLIAVLCISLPAVADNQLYFGDYYEAEQATYVFEYFPDRNFVMGVEGAFTDDQARIILTNNEDKSFRRFTVVDEIRNDGYYHLKAEHTGSYVITNSPAAGEMAVQSAAANGGNSDKWIFVYCGYDSRLDMNIVMIQNQAGQVLAPAGVTKKSDAAVGKSLVLQKKNLSDDSQKWYMRRYR